VGLLGQTACGGSVAAGTGDIDGGSKLDGATPPTSLPYVGSVSLSDVAQTSGDQRYATAYFQATPTGAAGCSGTVAGACCFLPSSAPKAASYVSAGQISITNAGASLASLTWNGTNYQSALPPTPWHAGDIFSIVASGGSVSGFSGSVTAPPSITGVSPAFSGAVVVSAGTDFVVSWTPMGAAGAEMGLTMSFVNGTSPDGSIGCTVEDSAGSITVPQAILEGRKLHDQVTLTLERAILVSASSANAQVTLYGSTSLESTGQLAAP
jgi:hypothetical protein